SCYIYFFCFTRPYHPRSSLLPYTTLFRSDRAGATPNRHPRTGRSGRGRAGCRTASRGRSASPHPRGTGTAAAHGSGPRGDRRRRSEEHTSELQSRENLVCRLLLEKKKILE